MPWWFFEGFGGPCEGVNLDSVDPGGLIARQVPVRQVVGAVVHMSSASPEPGLVRHVGGNRFILGSPTVGPPTGCGRWPRCSAGRTLRSSCRLRSTRRSGTSSGAT
ncbi:hypothetical protein ACFQZC_06990 [Streptacidiphilus monticola]